MRDEAKIVIAFVFERLGKLSVPPSDFYFSLSMDLRWCSVDKAKKFIEYALKEGLLENRNGKLTAIFPFKDIEIPFGFTPSIFEKLEDIGAEEDLKKRLARWISEKRSLDEQMVSKEIKSIAEGKIVFDEVAALIFANKLGIDTSEYLEEVSREISE